MYHISPSGSKLERLVEVLVDLGAKDDDLVFIDYTVRGKLSPLACPSRLTCFHVRYWSRDYLSAYRTVACLLGIMNTMAL